MKMKPPDEDKWEELGLEDKCTCNVYEWETICPHSYEIHDEIYHCECCPYHSQECAWSI
jgi:hypothetical protein